MMECESNFSVDMSTFPCKKEINDFQEIKREITEFIDAIIILPKVLVRMVTEYWSPTRTEGKFFKKWNIPQTQNQNMPYPLGLTHDGQRIFVSDTNQSCLYVYSLEGKHIDTWTSPPKLLSIFLAKNQLSFKDPKGIDFHGDYLYIIDIKYIRQIDKSSKKVIGKWSLPKGTIKFCGTGGCGLKVDDNQFYFTLWDSHQIYVYNPSSNHLKSYGKRFSTWRGGNEILEFDHPRGLTVAGEKLYACDYGNHRIQVLNKLTGEFIRSWGKEGKKNGELYFPEGIFLHDELLYIGDNEGVQVFGKEGAFIQRIGTTGRGRSGSGGVNRRLFSGGGGGGAADGQINHAKGICIVGNKLYVADNGNHRIQVFT